MSRLISVPFKRNLDTLYTLGINEANSFGGKVLGDKSEGLFSIPALGGIFEGTYKVSNNVISFNLTKKPLWVSYWMIEAFLKTHIQ